MVALRPDRIAAYSYAHLPELFKSQAVMDPATLPSADTKMALLELTIARLTEAGYVHIGMDHFALPEDELARAQVDGSLQRNFQGYTTHGGCSDLVGFGMSAIGQVGDCYVQNEKHEIPWIGAIDAGRLPLQRGLMTDADDRLRREVIGQIMCFGQIDYGQFCAHHGIDFPRLLRRLAGAPGRAGARRAGRAARRRPEDHRRRRDAAAHRRDGLRRLRQRRQAGAGGQGKVLAGGVNVTGRCALPGTKERWTQRTQRERKGRKGSGSRVVAGCVAP